MELLPGILLTRTPPCYYVVEESIAVAELRQHPEVATLKSNYFNWLTQTGKDAAFLANHRAACSHSLSVLDPDVADRALARGAARGQDRRTATLRLRQAIDEFVFGDADHSPNATAHVVNAFLKSAAQRAATRLAPATNPAGIVLDVGANDGIWSRALLAHAPAILRRRLHFHLLEPQPFFTPLLTMITRRHAPRWRFSASAAWTESNATLNLTVSRNDQASSLIVAAAQRYGQRGKPVPVRTVDLAALLNEHGRAPETPLLLKLDVEGGEYELIPHLLASGALCHATHVLIEWHLNSLPPQRRLQGFAMRHSIDEMLARGCSSFRTSAAGEPVAARGGRVRVAHIEYPPNNLGTQIVGLVELMHQRTRYVDVATEETRRGGVLWERVHAMAPDSDTHAVR